MNATAEDASSFKDYQGDKEIQKVLLALPLIAEVSGGRVLKMLDGSRWLVGVGSTVRRDASASETLRQQKVARLKAQAALVEFLNGSNVTATSVSKDSTSTKIENGRESAIVTETLDESIVTKAKGMIASMDVLGTWVSKDGSAYFMAIGKKLK